MNPRLLLIPLLLLACPAFASADDAEIKRTAKAGVQALNEATIKGEWPKIADLTHANVIKLMGGREKMIEVMEGATKEMKAQGVEILSAKAGEPSDIATQGQDLYLVVPFTLKMKFPDGKLTAEAYVVGVSGDRGKSWTFVNSSNSGSLKQVLPDLPSSLKLPEKKKPIVEKD